MPLYQIQLEWIRSLQNALRCPFNDTFFLILNYVDTMGFCFLIIVATSYLINRKVGFRLLYILILNSVLNGFLKNIFKLSRPCQDDPSVGLICSHSFGLPSGGTQLAVILAGVMWIESKNPVYRGLILLFSALVCFSRVYIGMHYFTDILGGLLVGACLVAIYAKLFPLLEKRERLATFLFPFFLLLFLGTPYVLTYFWITLGVALGLFLGKNQVCQLRKNRFMTLLTFFTSILGLFFLSFYFPFMMMPSAFFLGLFFTLGPPRISFLKSS